MDNLNEELNARVESAIADRERQIAVRLEREKSLRFNDVAIRRLAVKAYWGDYDPEDDSQWRELLFATAIKKPDKNPEE